MKTEIMKTAWEINKATGMSFSKCLKITWSVFKGTERDGLKLQQMGILRSISKLIKNGSDRNIFNKQWDNGKFETAKFFETRERNAPQPNNHPYGIGVFNAMRL